MPCEYDYSDSTLVKFAIPPKEYHFPALQEGDYLTLKMFDKWNIENVVSGYKHFYSDKMPHEILKAMELALDTRIEDMQSFNAYVFAVFDNGSCVSFSCHEDNDTSWRLDTRFYAKREIFPALWEKYKAIKFLEVAIDQPYITWATQTQQGIKTNRLKASANKNVRDVFYPTIKQGIDNFYNDYEESSSPILVIIGPPGMGKTSLIRNYIYQKHKEALITYDQKLMETDEFFLFYLEGEYDLLLLEDFDIFLKSREDNDNTIMSKFLNLSEGIVDISKKKIIVTANLDKSLIDEALIRPGRCYDVVELQPYHAAEAEAIVDTLNLTYDGSYDNVTLAELFNNRRKFEGRSKVGFHHR
jgi:hypothetical protein